MADEQTQPAAEAEQQPPAGAQTGADPGQQTETARTFSQADVDRIVAERLERAERKAAEKAERAKADAEADALKKQGEYQKLFEKAQAELDAERQRARGLEMQALRRDVAQKFQLPDALAKRLQGETQEELERDAQDLLAAIPKPAAPNINAGNAPAGSTPCAWLGGLSEQEFAARVGVRADLLGKQ